MPSVETFDCTMDAVYWEALRYDSHGEFVVLGPVAIKVRWNDDITDKKDPEGHKIGRDAVLSSLTNLVVGSIVWKGALADVPTPLTNLYQLDKDVSGLDVKNRRTRYLWNLSRFGDTLPTVVSGTGS